MRIGTNWIDWFPYPNWVSESKSDGEGKSFGDSYHENGDTDDEELDKLLQVVHVPGFLVDNECCYGKICDQNDNGQQCNDRSWNTDITSKLYDCRNINIEKANYLIKSHHHPWI